MIPKELLEQLGMPLVGDSRVQFSCQQCGACCQHRATDPIILTGYDMYQLAGALDKESTFDLITEGIVRVQSSRQGAPVCVLETTPEGSCILLDGTRCSVHSKKPAVCALYPFGRVADAEGNYGYFLPKGDVCDGIGLGEDRSFSRWLNQAKITQQTKYHAAYQVAKIEVISVLLNVKYKWYVKKVFRQTLWALYCNYDPKQDYLAQLRANAQNLRLILAKIPLKKHQLI